MMSNKKTIGIDPGASLGFSIWRGNKPVHYGTFAPSGDDQDERLNLMRRFIEELFHVERPDVVVLEDVSRFANKNRNSRVWLMFVYTLVRSLATEYGAECREILPQDLKRYVTGDRKADKSAIVAAVNGELGLQLRPTEDDTADALALVITDLDLLRKGGD